MREVVRTYYVMVGDYYLSRNDDYVVAFSKFSKDRKEFVDDEGYVYLRGSLEEELLYQINSLSEKGFPDARIVMEEEVFLKNQSEMRVVIDSRSKIKLIADSINIKDGQNE